MKGKLLLVSFMALLMMVGVFSNLSSLAAEPEYVKVSMTVTYNGKKLTNGDSLTNVKAGDKIEVTAKCSDQRAIDWSTNTNFMKDKGYTFNRDGMAFIGYMFDSEDSSKYIDDYKNPTSITITIPNFKAGSEHFVVINAVAACDGLVEEGKEIEATSGTFAAKIYMQEEAQTTVKESITKVDSTHVKVEAKVTNSTLEKHTYKWDSESEKESTSNPLTLEIPTSEGMHKLVATAISKDGKKDTATYEVEVKYEKMELTLVRDGNNAKATAKVTNGEFSKFTYNWDNEAKRDSNNNPLTVSLPTAVGKHTLYVTAYSKAGSTKSATLNYEVSAPDQPKVEKISITASKESNGVKVTANVENGKFVRFVYVWDNGEDGTITDNPATLPYPTSVGKHIFKVYALTESNKQSDVKTLEYEVKSPDALKGEITAQGPKGNLSEKESVPTEIKTGSGVTVKVDPEKNFSKVEYRWDAESFKELPSSRKITVPNFKKGTTHSLTIRGTLTDGGVITKVYYITIPNDEKFELDIDPWMKENEDAEGLLISLRNRSDSKKANQNFYMLDEEVIYLVDFKNAGKAIDSEVKVELKLPLEFTVVDSDGGDVDSSKKTITWIYADGLDKEVATTKRVTIKYTSLSKKSYNSEIVYPQAIIYKAGKKQDTSAVINCIYKDDSTKLEEVHSPYMFGDKDAPTFRPDDGISRAEGALVLMRIFGVNYESVKNITTKYSDIEDTYLEAQKAITKATELGVINGYPDGTYRPNDKMTRAEFMKIIASYVEADAEVDGLEIKEEDAIVIYKSGKSQESWAVPYVTLLARLNMTSASSSEKDLRLSNNITRAEVAQLCNFYLFRAPAKVTSGTMVDFTDVSRSHKLFGDIIEATREEHEFTITEDGREKVK